MRRAYVLLSGGIDSAVCLGIADKEFKGEVVGVSIDYGQRHIKEIKHAAIQCGRLMFPHYVIRLSSFAQTVLTNKDAPIPEISYDEISGISPTYAPFRNGYMLSAVTSMAHHDYKSYHKNPKDWVIYFGAHADDAHEWAYADCTPEFIGAMANAIWVGTYKEIRLRTPLQWLTKHEIIQKGEELHVDWKLTWSCYAGGDVHCGVCPTCRARRQAFIKAGVDDPTTYAA